MIHDEAVRAIRALTEADPTVPGACSAALEAFLDQIRRKDGRGRKMYRLPLGRGQTYSPRRATMAWIALVFNAKRAP